MADKKISALTGATTPLTGTEVLPIVQGGSTVKVAVSDLTAGRAVSASSVTVSGIATLGTGRQWFTSNDASYAFLSTVTGGSGNGIYADANNSALMVNGGGIAIATSTGLGITGNITPNTAAKGVNFTANTPAAGMTSQLLNWYEEGTWTPTDGSGAGLVFTVSGTATYIRVGKLVTVQAFINFPSTASTSAVAIAGLPFTSAASTFAQASVFTNAGVTSNSFLSASSSLFNLRNNTNASYTNVNFSDKFIVVTFTYRAA